MASKKLADNIETIKRAAAGRWRELLSALGGIPSDILDGRHHPCPKCGGADRFRLIDADAGAVLCNQCFFERNGDGIAAIQWMTGGTLNDTLERIAGHLGCKITTSKKATPTPDGKDSAVYAHPKAAIRSLLRALTPTDKSISPPKVARVDKYDTFWVMRINLPTPGGEKQRKTFRPIHSFPLPDGRAAWKFGYPEATTKRPLYRRAELLAAADTSLAVVCGGEKAAGAAAALGLAATTCAGGEKAVGHTDWLTLARFNQVVVAIDNDPAGQAYGLLVVEALRKAIRPDFPAKVLLLPGLPAKGDIVEWIAAGGTLEQFLGLAATKAESPKADPIAHDRLICDALRIDVLGELLDGSIKIFSEAHAKNVCLQSVDRLSYPGMLQHFGPIVREKVSQAQGGDVPPGMYHLSRVKEAIATVAGAERAGEGNELGLGCWPGKEDGGPAVVLVGAGEAGVWNGKGILEKIKKPRAAGLKFDISYPQHWYSHERLAGYLAGCTKTWADQAVEEASDIFSLWYWKTGQEITPSLVTGLVLATWVQTLWDWRPMVSVVGPSDCGKSSLFSTLESLFGPLALFNAKSTEAGLRQAIGNHAKVVLCDEFESDAHRKKILELLRTASRGSKTLRGTSNQSGLAFGLRHICWVAAVEIGLAREPDRNRFIALELTKPPPERRGKLVLPSETELEDLGQRLLAVAVWHATAARKLALVMKSIRLDGIHGRVVESFSVPCAMLAAVAGIGDNEDAAKDMMRHIFDGIEKDPTQGVSDEDELIESILSATIELPRGERASVSAILSRPNDYTEGWSALERVGITPVAVEKGRRPHELSWQRDGLFLATGAIRRYLLKGTHWEDQSIDQILKRIEGAERCQRRISGRRSWGIMLPWQKFSENRLGIDDPDELNVTQDNF